jgi:ABC-type uncharacterized transport system substrate-binding protein
MSTPGSESPAPVSLQKLIWMRSRKQRAVMAYTADQEEIFRRAGSLAAKILKGARPAELPVEQPTQLELIINLRTAKALGLTIPPSVLARADELIQ